MDNFLIQAIFNVVTERVVTYSLDRHRISGDELSLLGEWVDRAVDIARRRDDMPDSEYAPIAQQGELLCKWIVELRHIEKS